MISYSGRQLRPGSTNGRRGNTSHDGNHNQPRLRGTLPRTRASYARQGSNHPRWRLEAADPSTSNPQRPPAHSLHPPPVACAPVLEMKPNLQRQLLHVRLRRALRQILELLQPGEAAILWNELKLRYCIRNSPTTTRLGPTHSFDVVDGPL